MELSVALVVAPALRLRITSNVRAVISSRVLTFEAEVEYLAHSAMAWNPVFDGVDILASINASDHGVAVNNISSTSPVSVVLFWK